MSDLLGGKFNNGTYVVTGSTLAVAAALDELVFTPTPHQLLPGGTVTTGFAVAVTDTKGLSSTGATTTVTATAVNDPSVIAGTLAGQTTSDEASVLPFATVSISEVDFGQTETVTVTLSNPADGALSNLGGGSYDNATGGLRSQRHRCRGDRGGERAGVHPHGAPGRAGRYEGQGDSIASFAASPANVTLGAQSTGDLLFGGSTALNATVEGTNDTVVGGSGPSTIDASQWRGGFWEFRSAKFRRRRGHVNDRGRGRRIGDGDGRLRWRAVLAGANDNPTIVGGSGVTTVVGSAGSSIVFSSLSGSGGVDFLAGSGNESLDAANSSTSNTFGFFDAATSPGGGAQDTVTGWSTQDSLFLMGYDSTTATTVGEGGNFTVDLTHGATIPFTDANSSAFIGRMLYVPAPPA